MSNSIEFDFQKVCRTCLTGTNLKPLYHKCALQECLEEMLMICTSMEYSEDDGLPVQICTDCIRELNRSYQFALKCRTSDNKLRLYIQKLVPEEYAIPNCSNANYGHNSKNTNTPKDLLDIEVKTEANQNLILIKNEPEDENIIKNNANIEIKIEPNKPTSLLEIDKFNDGIKIELINEPAHFEEEQPMILGSNHAQDVASVTIALNEEENEEPKNKRRRVWVKPRLLKRKNEGEFFTVYKELLDDESKFYQHFKMSKTKFDTLLSKIEMGLKKRNTQFRDAITPIQKLAVCLRFLTTGESFRRIAFNYRLGNSTVHNIVREVCKVIIDTMLLETIPPPKKQDWQKIADDFLGLRHFPNCLGALGGKQTVILVPAYSKSQFNYEKTFSVVLLALVDANYKFIAVDIGSYENNSEGGIFAKSKLGRDFDNKKLDIPEDTNLPNTTQIAPYVVAADESFPLKSYMVRPYPALQLENDVEKKIYNYRLSRAQRVAEYAFGILAHTFQIYNRRKLTAKPDNVDNFILTTCILHNFIRDDSVWGEQDRTSNELPSNLLKICKQGGNAPRAAYNVRETYKTYFNSEAGSVPWQADKI